jgi:putative acetyltransferase
MTPGTAFEIRLATRDDVDAIAAAHRDSIASIGPRYYDAEIVQEWGSRITGEMYFRAMANGERFFIAVASVDGERTVLGFSSHRVDGRVENDVHGTAVYVRGAVARQGVGTALFRTAEAAAIASGATALTIDASLAAVDFYKANGFEETGRGEHPLPSGRPMACVFMTKTLTP